MTQIQVVNNTHQNSESIESELQRLRQRNLWLNLAENTAKVGHWYLNLRDQSMFWSDQVRRIHGIDINEELPDLEDAINYYHEEDRPLVKRFLEHAIKSENVSSFKLRLIDRSGDIRHVKSFAQADFDEDGNAIGLFGVFQDVTDTEDLLAELYDKQLQLEHIQDASLDGFWDWNLETNEEYLSPRFKKMFGYEDHEMENSVDAWKKIIFKDDLIKVEDAFKAHINEGKPYEPLVRYHHRNGSTVWVMCRGKALFDKSGKPVRMIGAHTDVTELKRAEAKLLANMETLQHFTRLSSHDLREPLRGISFFTTQIGTILEERGLLEGELKRFFEFITSSVRRMDSLIEDISYFNRLPGEIEFTAVDLKDVIATVRSALDFAIKDSGALFYVDNLPVVRGSQNLLVSVFQNLIHNAIKFVKKNEKPKIKIFCEESVDGNYYCVKVKDNGIGIEKRFQEEVFKPFRRLHPSHEYEGSGVGLAITKRVIELHLGSVSIDSKDGEGTTFTLLFPK